jgi:spectinomycin phosphotransferase
VVLKLGRSDGIEPARAEFALQLGRTLAELGLPVPRPQPTRDGAWWCWLGGLRLVLFEFIDGQPLSDQDLSAAELTEQVAGLAAAIHGATGALAVPVPFTETFEVEADGLRRCLAELEAGAGDADGLVAEAWALVWPQRMVLLGMQQRVQALGDAVRSQPWELVLCHGDLRGDNLLEDRAGRVWLVDWDGAVLAPCCAASPIHELFRHPLGRGGLGFFFVSIFPFDGSVQLAGNPAQLWHQN